MEFRGDAIKEYLLYFSLIYTFLTISYEYKIE